MKVQILREAKDDLIEGFSFYERQEQGAGDYFLTNLESDIESLAVLGAYTPSPMESSTVAYQKSSRSQFTTAYPVKSF